MESPWDASSSSTNAPEEGDPVAKQVDWSPLIKGGANFRTHKLKKVGYHTYKSVPTSGYNLFLGMFIFFGLIAILAGSIFGLQESFFAFLVPFIMGAIFSGIGGFLFLKALKPLTIDLDMGVFYKGKSYDPYEIEDGDDSGSIRDIYALQLISERVSGSESTYTSYELNLVLKDGRRFNVMDHGNLKKLQADTLLLSKALDVPIWDSSKRPEW